MTYRDDRYRCMYAAPFRVHGRVRGGTVLNVSKSGMLAFIGPNLRTGQRVSFTINGSEHHARIVRIDICGHAALRFDKALSPAEVLEITGPLSTLQKNQQARSMSG